jgi:hypothetical protein
MALIEGGALMEKTFHMQKMDIVCTKNVSCFPLEKMKARHPVIRV